MVQLNILCGKRAGATYIARRFPVRIGRGPKAGLRSEEDGVWDEHALLEFRPSQGVALRVQPGALARVGGQPAGETLLRNGDVIELGSLKLQFWLSETHQTRLLAREWATWIGIGAISLGQMALIYWLVRAIR
jgi:hypothetical protein